MKRIVEACRKLEDGLHTGVIIEVVERKEPFEYLDIVIETDDQVRAVVGFPDTINPSSNLGKLLMRFGYDLLVGDEIDIMQFFIGKKVQFQSTTIDGKDGSQFSKIIPTSLKLLK